MLALYTQGPIISLLESALQSVVGLPVIKNTVEVFQSYDNGVAYTGVANSGQIFAPSNFDGGGGFFTAPDMIGAYVYVTTPTGPTSGVGGIGSHY